ncbi:hypothetical protein C8J57DRAFT_1482462 [Mycena rebaudengoi]|nr:hypothetical protein C8J57DRAFT_1482462 [Mycena rebaudengoi]
MIDNKNVRAVKELVPRSWSTCGITAGTAWPSSSLSLPPSTPSSTSSQQTTMNILDNILPVLRVAQATAAGNPVPGLEGAITGVVALAEMVSTMKGNKADLPDLAKRLEQLTDIDTVGCSDNLKQRLDKLKENLEPITTRLISLEKKSKFKQFLKGKMYEKEIQGIKASITSHIQDFTVRFPSFFP